MPSLPRIEFLLSLIVAVAVTALMGVRIAAYVAANVFGANGLRPVARGRAPPEASG